MKLVEDGRVLISPSRLKTWQECPLKWKAMYVDEVRLTPTPSLVFGTAIHEALEHFHRSRWIGNSIGVSELEDVFRNSIHSVAEIDPLTVDQEKQGIELIALYVNRFSNESVAAAELSLRAPLIDRDTGEDLGADLMGIIDLITEGKVVDLKTSSRTSDMFDLVLSHSIQMDAYRWLLRDMGKEVKEAEIRLLVRKKVPTIETFNMPQRGFGSFLDLCRKYVSFVKEGGNIGPRPGFLCGETCPAYAACRQFHGLEAA